MAAPVVAKRSGGVQGRCKALFTYNPANPDELPLCVGDVLEVLCEVEEGWWQGRRQGRVGVFPSNFVVMLDGPAANAAPPPYDPAPALPPKPVKEQCRVLFPYIAVNEDELSLAEGDIVTIVSKEAPDRGWWRGEVNGRVGLFPDNFVQILPTGATEVEEKKPDRPPSKNIYPILNKYSEKTSSIKELTTLKTSLHKDSTLNKEMNAHKETIITHTNKNESEKSIHSETINDGTLDGQLKKPPVPIKKSPTPSTGVGGLFSGLKNKMMSSDKDKSTPVSSNTSSSSGEWDKPDGIAPSKTSNTNTFDHIERNSILNDPRASRVKAPRRRPPSQTVPTREEQQIGLSNGHEAVKPVTDKIEEIKPKAREWEKNRVPWMDELKLNQAKKTSFGEVKSRSVCSNDTPVASKAGGGSTDRILECGLEEKKSTHSMEMSKSTSSISSRISVLESFEETKTRHSVDSKKEEKNNKEEPLTRHSMHSPTAAGRTLTTMLDEIKKPQAPSPPSASVRTNTEKVNIQTDRTTEPIKPNSVIFEKPSAVSERIMVTEKSVSEEKPVDRPADRSSSSTLERRSHSVKVYEKTDGTDALINQLNDRILNLEKLLEVQNAKFTAAIEELSTRLQTEMDKRQTLQTEVEKLAHCVTQV